METTSDTQPTGTFVDIKEAYVDEKLREFFETEKHEVNIDNICLFSSKVIEEYNFSSETKLMGKQKLEAAVDLSKTIIEKTVAFVPEDLRRQVVKNIYYNIESIPQTIQFIVDISNNPNLINAEKWILNTVKKTKEAVKEKTPGLIKRMFSCCSSTKKTEEPLPQESEETVPETKVEEPVVKVSKSEEKALANKAKKEAELRAKLEELNMTPEERKAKKEAEKEAAKQKIEQAKAEKKAAEQKKKDDAEREKREKRAAQLREELEKLSEKPAEEVKEVKEEVKTESVEVELTEIAVKDE